MEHPTTSKTILQIVSGFQPDVDGMGDFSRRLGQALWANHGIRSHFLVFRQPRKPGAFLDPALIAPNTLSYPAEATPAALLSHIADLQAAHSFDSILVHYGPYAYTSNGLPSPFAAAIEDLVKRTEVLIFFHETYAYGPPWRRSFWTKHDQKISLGRLMRSAKIAFTSNAKYIRMLTDLDDVGRELIKAPVISNIGEPDNLPPLADRARRLVIFGQINNRVRLYKKHGDKVTAICKALRIESIADVGSGQSPYIPAEVLGAKVERKGFMIDEALSALMADSIAGVICYWPDTWEKSGVLAAFAAHALVPILVPMEKRHLPEPKIVPYVSTSEIVRRVQNDGCVPQPDLQTMADAAHVYYIQHQSVNRCAALIARYAIHR